MGFLRNDLVEISILAVCPVVRGAWTVLVVGRSRVAAPRAPGLGRQLLPYVPAGSCFRMCVPSYGPVGVGSRSFVRRPTWVCRVRCFAVGTGS